MVKFGQLYTTKELKEMSTERRLRKEKHRQMMGNDITINKYIDNKNLIGKHSKFNGYSHQKYDIPARNAILDVMGEYITENPDMYQQDMIINIENCRYKYLELQVCTAWIDYNFPYDNVYVYERKKKYGDDTLFLTLSKNLEHGYLFRASSLKNIKPTRIKKYAREYVYKIPNHLTLRVSIPALDDFTFQHI